MFGPCCCGHDQEAHGNDPDFPGSTACTECDCIAYDEDGDYDPDTDE